ncbi:MAG: HAD hydrolase-like protein, partial [Eubacteriaceae bacterium]|nr:HAD hydrolase-like protein [Eubacteriaceae bacterium]
MTIKMIVFDLDGTLVNSLEGIAYSMNLVLKNHDLPIYSTEKYKYFVGNGLKVLTERAIPPDKKNQLEYFYGLMLESYRKNYSKDLALYEGIAELLDELTQRGYKMGINTNKHQDVTERTVDMVLSKWKFTSVVGSESGYPK